MVTAKLHLWPTFYLKRQIFKGVRRVASAWPVAHSARAWDAAARAVDRVLTSPPRLGRLMARACVLFIVCVWNWINNFSPPALHSPLHALNLLHTTIARLPVLSSSETQRRTFLFMLAEWNTTPVINLPKPSEMESKYIITVYSATGAPLAVSAVIARSDLVTPGPWPGPRPSTTPPPSSRNLPAEVGAPNGALQFWHQCTKSEFIHGLSTMLVYKTNKSVFLWRSCSTLFV